MIPHRYTVLPIVGLALLFGAYELLRRRHPKSREIFMLCGLLGTHMLYTTVFNCVEIRERSIRPKISRIDFDLAELENFEVRPRRPSSPVDFHTGF